MLIRTDEGFFTRVLSYIPHETMITRCFRHVELMQDRIHSVDQYQQVMVAGLNESAFFTLTIHEFLLS
jgi:hypothetical protein